jgi:hypothetical protein
LAAIDMHGGWTRPQRTKANMNRQGASTMNTVKATRTTAEFGLLPRSGGVIGLAFAAWLAVSMFFCPLIVAGDELADGFCHPPESTKPWCYWYWISDNLSKEGISRDLEAMARVGIGEAFIGNIFLKDVPAGDVKALSEPWWEMVEHAIREAGRVGVNIGMFNCPGWSQSGGPWIQPDQAMRYLASSEIRIQGPVQFKGKLPTPATPFQDVAVLAFPAPQHDADRWPRYLRASLVRPQPRTCVTRSTAIWTPPWRSPRPSNRWSSTSNSISRSPLAICR